MKGLLKYLSPFAPDQSGAVSVLFDLGGLTVICDAGGCAGNICGFDEPRWFMKQSAVFSAGLRDMDAILGRDDRLVQKLKLAADQLDCKFAALIGTPVPAVIATDFKALQRMAEKKTNLPVVTVDCTGTRLYDEGASDTYLALFEKFAGRVAEGGEMVVSGRVGVLGATPLDTSHIYAGEVLEKALKNQGYSEVWVYGMGAGLEKIRQAGSVEKNIVIAPSGLKVAKYLKKEFGTPYEISYPMLKTELKEKLKALGKKKVLIIHQQVLAEEIRNQIHSEDVTVAGFFLMRPPLKRPQDVKLQREEQFVELVEQGDYDVIIADSLLKRAIPNFKGEFIHVPHFAISGEYEDERNN